MGLIAWLERKIRERILPSQRHDSRRNAEAGTPSVLPSKMIAGAPVQNLPVLLSMLTSDKSGERKAAAVGLGRSGDVETAYAPLVTLLRHDPVPEVRAAAAGALGALGDTRAIADLTAALGDFGEITTARTVYDWAREGEPQHEKATVLYTVSTTAREALATLGSKA